MRILDQIFVHENLFFFHSVFSSSPTTPDRSYLIAKFLVKVDVTLTGASLTCQTLKVNGEPNENTMDTRQFHNFVCELLRSIRARLLSWYSSQHFVRRSWVRTPLQPGAGSLLVNSASVQCARLRHKCLGVPTPSLCGIK